jgi:hypothetical protein
VTSTVLNMLVIPALYLRFGEEAAGRARGTAVPQHMGVSAAD